VARKICCALALSSYLIVAGIQLTGVCDRIPEVPISRLDDSKSAGFPQDTDLPSASPSFFRSEIMGMEKSTDDSVDMDTRQLVVVANNDLADICFQFRALLTDDDSVPTNPRRVIDLMMKGAECLYAANATVSVGDTRSMEIDYDGNPYIIDLHLYYDSMHSRVVSSTLSMSHISWLSVQASAQQDGRCSITILSNHSALWIAPGSTAGYAFGVVTPLSATAVDALELTDNRVEPLSAMAQEMLRRVWPE